MVRVSLGAFAKQSYGDVAHKLLPLQSDQDSETESLRDQHVYGLSDSDDESYGETAQSEAGQTVESDEDSDDGQLRHVYDHELDASHAAGRKRKSVALRGSTRGLPGALLESDDDHVPYRQRHPSHEQDDVYEPLGHPRGPLAQWLAKPLTQSSITRRVLEYLEQARDSNGNLIFKERIRDMCIDSQQSLFIDLAHMCSHPGLEPVCTWLHACPRAVWPALNQAVRQAVLSDYKEYGNIHTRLFARFEAVEPNSILAISALRVEHTKALVRVQGIVTKRERVLHQLLQVCLTCRKCACMLGPFAQEADQPIRPGKCPNCQAGGPFELDQQHTLFENVQMITVQEDSSSIEPGHQARQLVVTLKNDLVNKVIVGRHVTITGVPDCMPRYGRDMQSMSFYRCVEAFYVRQSEDESSSYYLTEADKNSVLDLAKDPKIAERIVRSIAPSIHGHLTVKRALAATLFGGVPKPLEKHKIRGDMNLLLVGDPGIAKSQFLKYTQKVTPRNVYVTGQGASSVGLTACAQQDKVTREWTLQGGALAVADRGVCLIDEFDKMRDNDRSGVHEAMEQQTISTTKVGLHVTLQARCSVIAAANPLGGRYAPRLSLKQNLDLTEPILSRFDIIVVMQDKQDNVADTRLAEHVVGVHHKSHPDYVPGEGDNVQPADPDADTLSQDMLRKYIVYAKEYIHPKLPSALAPRVVKAYADARQAAAKCYAVSVTPRFMEATIRTAEASARMHLRNEVQEEDMDMAISLVLGSFISCQPITQQLVLKKRFARELHPKRDYNALIMHKLEEVSKRCELILPSNYAEDVIQMGGSVLQLELVEHAILVDEHFYNSTDFQASKFSRVQQGNMITWPKPHPR